jgi:hypothetical protein
MFGAGICTAYRQRIARLQLLDAILAAYHR